MQIEDRPGFVFWDVMVGGGSVSLAVARAYPRARLCINDLDENIFSFWKVVAASSDADYTRLISKLNVQPTIELFNFMLAKEPQGVLDRAFRAIFFNRASHITAIGKRPLGGWDQVKYSIDSRWNYERTMRRMLEARRLLHGRTTVTGDDFDPVLVRAGKTDGFVFCDPPYYKPGNELYHSTQWTHKDHVRLCEHLNSMDGWLLCYDDHPSIRKLYEDKDIQTLPMKYSAGIKRKRVNELLIKPKEAVLWRDTTPIRTGESRSAPPRFQP
jgi:DNA adenine methylase